MNARLRLSETGVVQLMPEAEPQNSSGAGTDSDPQESLTLLFRDLRSSAEGTHGS